MKKLFIIVIMVSVPLYSMWADFFTEAIADDLRKRDPALETVAISSVTMLSGEENELCRLYKHRMVADLVEHTPFVVVDRENQEDLLSEIEHSQGDLSAEKATLKIGRMLNAQALLSLVIAELQEGTEIIVRLTEVETARLVYSRSFRDFSEEPATGNTDYNPDRDLKPGDYASQPNSTAPTPEQPPILLRPTREQKERQLGLAHRKEMAERLAISNRMYALRTQNPRLYWAIVEARKRLHFISRDKALFTLFIFHNRPLTQYMKQTYPGLTRTLYRKFLDIKKRQPQKEKLILLYLKQFGPIIQRDQVLKNAVRQGLDEYIEQHAANF